MYTKMTNLKAPFPWFGGKSKVADLVWARLGDVPNYVEPFFGSGAVLLGCPHDPKTETVNDKDGFISNFWRAMRSDPDAVASHADRPVNENDLHAVHASLALGHTRQDLVERLEGNLDFYDAKIAGLWAWGLCCWIGSGWTETRGPWSVDADGRFVKRDDKGVSRQLPHLGNRGKGVTRQLPHLGDRGQGVTINLPHLGDFGRGVNRKLPLVAWFRDLADRLARVRVCCGDWERICGSSPTVHLGLTGVFLDPPYGGDAGRNNDLYAVEDLTVAQRVLDWCVENGDSPKLRIALCGYDGEHNTLADDHEWSVVKWTTSGGYGSQGKDNQNKKRERIWFSPACLDDKQQQLF